MENLIIGLALKPTMSPRVHQTGHTHKWMELLNADVKPNFVFEDLMSYRNIYICNGINQKDSSKFNFPGGMDSSKKEGKLIIDRYEMVHAAHCEGVEFVQLDTERKHYTSLRSRKTFEDIPYAWAWMDKEIKHVEQHSFSTTKLVVSDSHGLGVAPYAWPVIRLDGCTLNGVLFPNREKGKLSLKEYIKDGTTHVLFKFGDIDLRHHVWRHGGIAAVERMVLEYYRQAMEISATGVEVFVGHAMPQTADSREIPGSIQYNGESFYGTLEQRQAATAYFNLRLDQLFGVDKTVKYEGYTTLDGCLDETMMEQKRSVHLCRASYNNKWYKG